MILQSNQDTPVTLFKNPSYHWLSSKNYLPNIVDGSIAVNAHGGIDGLTARTKTIFQRPT